MPRLNPVFKRAVFFLYGTNPKTGKRVGPQGTGFLIGAPALNNWYLQHFYAVTCQHVAPRGASILRINTADGGSRFIEVHPDEWQWIPGHDDVAAVDITERIKRETDVISVIPASMLVTKEFVAEEELEIGEDGFMLGLFADLPSKKKNLIAARFGNISLLADDDTPIKQPNDNHRPSHIFDMRSRPGFSGSPVFVYRTPAGDLRDATERGRMKAFRRRSRYNMVPLGGGQPMNIVDYDSFIDDMETEKNTFLMLLGIHAGQYHDTVKFLKSEPKKAENDKSIRHGDKVKIPNSMAIVVPSWEILKLLELPLFVEQRKQRDEAIMKRYKKENSAEPEATDPSKPDAKLIPPASDDNPNAREDFMRLQGAAARKQPQGD
jgi:hypothetical protein